MAKNSFFSGPDASEAGSAASPVSENGAGSVPKTMEAGKPGQLAIRSIQVKAKGEHIGLTADGAVGVTAGAKNVSWFSEGVKPGEQGSALISGHYGVWNNGTDSVFNLLPTVKTGDRVSVKDDRGVMRTFTVEKTRVYGKDDIAPELFANYGDVRLNLISCY